MKHYRLQLALIAFFVAALPKAAFAMSCDNTKLIILNVLNRPVRATHLQAELGSTISGISEGGLIEPGETVVLEANSKGATGMLHHLTDDRISGTIALTGDGFARLFHYYGENYIALNVIQPLCHLQVSETSKAGQVMLVDDYFPIQTSNAYYVIS